MGNDKKNVQEVAKKSFLGQVGGFITTGASIVFEEIKYFLNPMNWGHSGRRVWHEVKQVANQVLRKPIKEYFSRVKTEPYSEYSIRIAEQGGGYVVIKASDIFTGKIQEMSDAQIDKVNALSDENKNFDIHFDPAKKKIEIEIDVYKIINDITDDPDNKGKTEEEIKKLAIGKIIEEADSSLKKLANIVGGEFSKYADSQLLTGVGKRLYQPYEKQKDESKSPPKKSHGSSEDVLPQNPLLGSSEVVSHSQAKNSSEILSSPSPQTMQSKTTQPISESDSSLTNPHDMPHQKSSTVQDLKVQSLILNNSDILSGLGDVKAEGDVNKTLTTQNANDKVGKSRC